MRIAILTNEYPPHIYGGAGVHVDYLTRELAKLSDGSKCSLRILCFGDQDQAGHHVKVKGIAAPAQLAVDCHHHQKLVDTLQRNVIMTGALNKGGHYPLPHLVHPPGRLPVKGTPGRAPGPHHPFPGAPAPLEGRAAGAGLPGQHLGGAHRLRERRRGHRRVQGHAPGRPHHLRRAPGQSAG